MRLGLAAIALALVSSGAGGQCSNIIFLPASASTRALGVGDANVAGRDDDVIFYNPAQVAVARGTSAAVERYGLERNGGTVAAAVPFGAGGFGVGATLASSPHLPCGTDTPPYELPPVSGHRLVAAAGVAQSWKHTRFGLAAKYVEEQIGSGSSSAPLLDVGVGHDYQLFDRAAITLGAAIQNIGNRDRQDIATITPLTTSLGAATGFPVGPLDLAIAGRVDMPWWEARSVRYSRDLHAGGGVEVGYSWLDGYSVALRGGVRRRDHDFGTGNWTGGASLVLDRITIDYAFEQLIWPDNGVAHRIGLRVR